MFEELDGHDRADRVTAAILGAARAASVAVETRHRVGAAFVELAAEHIAFAFEFAATQYAGIGHGRRITASLGAGEGEGGNLQPLRQARV